VSKHWKPGKTTVQLNAAVRPAARPSRIRREPVALNANVPAKPQRPLNYRERELFFGIAGILIFGTLIAAGVIALSIFTVFHDDPEADARAARFNQCYAAAGPNCVLDGDTIYVGGERVEIAGMEAPRIADAACDLEHDRGVVAATELALLLNSGPVTLGPPFRDGTGRSVRKVEVGGRDVALKMIDQSVAHEANSGLGWCH
jgi:endonuclease YncB( thermonuclease family)